MPDSIKISVIMTSYNHESYIREAIDSVLSQEGVNLEIIMSDDCSKDNTFQIMEEYARKYPNIINLISNKRNLGLSKNMQNAIKKAQGEYIAFCEGDDYWTDRRKLYKQVNFLNKNRDISLCSNQVKMINELLGQDIEHKAQINHIKKGNLPLSTKQIILNYFVGNLTSIVIRSEVIKNFPNKIYDFLVADWLFCILASERGDIYIMPEIMSVHRIHKNNLWVGKADNSKYIEVAVLYNKLTDYKYDTYFKKLIRNINKHKIYIDQISFLKRLAFLILPPIIVIGIVKVKKFFRKKFSNYKQS